MPCPCPSSRRGGTRRARTATARGMAVPGRPTGRRSSSPSLSRMSRTASVTGKVAATCPRTTLGPSARRPMASPTTFATCTGPTVSTGKTVPARTGVVSRPGVSTTGGTTSSRVRLTTSVGGSISAVSDGTVAVVSATATGRGRVTFPSTGTRPTATRPGGTTTPGGRKTRAREGNGSAPLAGGGRSLWRPSRVSCGRPTIATVTGVAGAGRT